MWNGLKVKSHLVELQATTNNMADVLQAIRLRAEGRGINPAEAKLFNAKLNEIETKLRQLGANEADPIPDMSKIEPIVWNR